MQNLGNILSVKYLIIFFLLLNIGTFIVYGIDKWKAKKNDWRIPEITLLVLAAVGGSLGALIGMQVWRHKTQHKKFVYGVPAILVCQIILVLYIAFSSTK